MWDIICSDVKKKKNRCKWNLIDVLVYAPLSRENILVLDIFFEALNYEKIEQKKAYEIAGLLGKIPAVSCLLWGGARKKKKKRPQNQHPQRPLPHISHHVFMPAALRFPLWTCETGWAHFHNLMLLRRAAEFGPDVKLELDGHFWQLRSDYSERYWLKCDGWGVGWFHAPLFNYCTCPYLSISPSPGDIGGQMGLFIGASVLTILEIFDYLYEVMSWSLLKEKFLRNSYIMFS